LLQGADVKHKNKQGKTAEMLAIGNSHTDLAELLRRAGALRSTFNRCVSTTVPPLWCGPGKIKGAYDI